MKQKIIIVLFLLFGIFAFSCNKKKINDQTIKTTNLLAQEEMGILGVPDVPKNAPLFEYSPPPKSSSPMTVNLNAGIPDIEGRSIREELNFEAKIEQNKLQIPLPTGTAFAYDDEGNPFVFVIAYKKAVEVQEGQLSFKMDPEQKMIFSSIQKQNLSFSSDQKIEPFYIDPLNFIDPNKPEQAFVVQFAILPNAANYNQYAPVPYFALVNKNKGQYEVVIDSPNAWADLSRGLSVQALARIAEEASKDNVSCSIQESDPVRATCIYERYINAITPNENIIKNTRLVTVGIKKTEVNNHILVYPQGININAPTDNLSVMTYNIFSESNNLNIQEPFNITISEPIGGQKKVQITIHFNTKINTQKETTLLRSGNTVNVYQDELLQGYSLKPDLNFEKNKKNLVPFLYRENIYWDENGQNRNDFLGNPKEGNSRGIVQTVGKKWLIPIFIGAGSLVAAGVGVGIWQALSNKPKPPINTIDTVYEITNLSTLLYRAWKENPCQNDILERLKIATKTTMNGLTAQMKRKLYYGLKPDETISVFNSREDTTIEHSTYTGYAYTYEIAQTDDRCNASHLKDHEEIKFTMQKAFDCSIQSNGSVLLPDGEGSVCGISNELAYLKNTYFSMVFNEGEQPGNFFTLLDLETKIQNNNNGETGTKHDYVFAATVVEKNKIGYDQLQLQGGARVGYWYILLLPSILGGGPADKDKEIRIVTPLHYTLNAMKNEFIIKKK